MTRWQPTEDDIQAFRDAEWARVGLRDEGWEAFLKTLREICAMAAAQPYEEMRATGVLNIAMGVESKTVHYARLVSLIDTWAKRREFPLEIQLGLGVITDIVAGHIAFRSGAVSLMIHRP